MCDTCVAETVDYGEVLPHWWLVRATKESEFMYPDEWGLVWTNDASYIWTENPEPDPSWESEHDENGVLLDTKDVKPQTPEEENTYKQWYEKCMKFEESLISNPWTGYQLMQACIKAGYTEDEGRVAFWLFNKLGEFLFVEEATPEWRAKVANPGYELDEHDRLILRVLHRKHKTA